MHDPKISPTVASPPQQTAEPAVSDSYRRLLENDIVKKLPKHLKQFIVDQNYIAYTAQDHSVWRYVLRQNRRFLIEYAHKIYFEGLEKTGLKIEAIPSIIEMNHILSKIGWAAVTVDGFIPPAAFMEFQAHRVLVIASDMRQIHHIEYTPSPDIIHEAAGHAPVIADSTYAEYLRRIGYIGSKAMSSKKDFELYEAIRKLSLLKEQRDADPQEVKKAEDDVIYRQSHLGKPSEMALLSRLHWWTVEYGLIGTLDNPKIYGAGLLSSIGEAAHCFTDEVKKLPYKLETTGYAFDITTMQPQLFVTPDFDHLIDVLEKFADTMAFRTGGIEGIRKAIECENTATCEYSSGVQVSGTFTEVLTDENDIPIYIKTAGLSNLAFNYQELPGHDTSYHRDGFGSPIGKLKGESTPLEELTDDQLAKLHIETGTKTKLEFESGTVVDGSLSSIEQRDGKIILMTFNNCKVSLRDKILFDPSWGVYDMAVGAKIVSVFAGAADKDAYQQPSAVSKRRTVKFEYSPEQRDLFALYQKIRNCREKKADSAVLPLVWEELKTKYRYDWLLPVEILELLSASNLFPEVRKEIRAFLEQKGAEEQEYTKLITDGLYLIDHPETIA
ncbi:MAG TPA: aromatic amino acid hydroxylase [candidate division Zixibacteria bacterium]|nr:aromatic amino acid hydroxylase [candidate division Zixibacteria bacterium]